MPKIKGVNVTQAQKAVYDALRSYGPLPDHALVPLTQHVAHEHQSSSGIRTRRRELERKGLVVSIDLAITNTGRKANVFKAL